MDSFVEERRKNKEKRKRKKKKKKKRRKQQGGPYAAPIVPPTPLPPHSTHTGPHPPHPTHAQEKAGLQTSKTGSKSRHPTSLDSARYTRAGRIRFDGLERRRRREKEKGMGMGVGKGMGMGMGKSGGGGKGKSGGGGKGGKKVAILRGGSHGTATTAYGELDLSTPRKVGGPPSALEERKGWGPGDGGWGLGGRERERERVMLPGAKVADFASGKYLRGVENVAHTPVSSLRVLKARESGWSHVRLVEKDEDRVAFLKSRVSKILRRDANLPAVPFSRSVIPPPQDLRSASRAPHVSNRTKRKRGSNPPAATTSFAGKSPVPPISGAPSGGRKRPTTTRTRAKKPSTARRRNNNNSTQIGGGWDDTKALVLPIQNRASANRSLATSLPPVEIPYTYKVDHACVVDVIPSYALYHGFSPPTSPARVVSPPQSAARLY